MPTTACRFVRRSPLPKSADGRKRNSAPRGDLRRAYYLEADVDAWIRARIRGEKWFPAAEHPEPLRLIPRRETLRRVGLSGVTLWKMERAGLFPRPVRPTETGMWTGEPAA